MMQQQVLLACMYPHVPLLCTGDPVEDDYAPPRSAVP